MQENLFMGKAITNTIGVLVMIGVLGMIWRAGTITFIPVYWISKIGVVGAGCALLMGMLTGTLPYKNDFMRIIERYRFALALLITPFIGLAGSTLFGFGWGAYFPLIRFEYIRILFVFVLFFITAYTALARPHAIRRILAYIVVSCLPLWLSLNPAWKLFPLEVGRLTGTGNDSNFLAAWIAVALITTVIFFLWERHTVRWIWLAGTFAIAPLLLWTACRAAWLTALLAAIGIIYIFLKQNFSRKRASDISILLTTITASLVCGFLFFPPLSRVVIAIRALEPFVSHERLVRAIQWAAPPDTIRKEDFPMENGALGITDELFTMVGADRGWLWREGFKKLLRAPLGFGQAYYFWNPVGTEGKWTKHKLDAHNLWLDVGLSMGWIGIAIWLIFVFRIACDTLRTGWSGNPERLATTTSLFTLLFISTFMDMFTQPILWIIAGLIAGSVTTPELRAPSQP